MKAIAICAVLGVLGGGAMTLILETTAAKMDAERLRAELRKCHCYTIWDSLEGKD